MRPSLAKCAKPRAVAISSNIWTEIHRAKALDRSRSEIISPELCRYALKALRPELPAPGTCDVVDLNPGPCIWSEALNHALKPRRHVLIEPDEKRFKNDITAIIKKQGNYRLATKMTEALDVEQDLLSPELRAETRASKATDKLQPTKQLILTANLSTKGIRSEAFVGPLAKFFIHQYYKAIFYRTSYLEFGSVGAPKLLLWIPDKFKHSYLPRTTVYRSRGALSLEACCDVREVVGGYYNENLQSQRQTKHINIMAQMDEIEKLPKRLPNLPKNRIQPRPEPPYNGVRMDVDAVAKYNSLQQKPRVVKDFLKLLSRATKVVPEGDLLTAKSQDLKKTVDYAGFSEFFALRRRLSWLNYAYERVESFAKEQLALERSYVDRVRDNPHDGPVFFDKLRPAFKSIQSRLNPVLEDTQHAVKKSVDDFRTLLSTPRAMAFNKRPYEPILCHGSDFSRDDAKMCLLEITPKESFHQLLDTTSKILCLDFVIDCFLVKSSENLERNLRQLLVMAPDNEEFQRFVQSVPSLNDPSKGIVNDLDMIRARSLPIEVWIDIALAYHDWPLRKSDDSIKQHLNASKDSIGTVKLK